MTPGHILYIHHIFSSYPFNIFQFFFFSQARFDCKLGRDRPRRRCEEAWGSPTRHSLQSLSAVPEGDEDMAEGRADVVLGHGMATVDLGGCKSHALICWMLANFAATCPMDCFDML